MPRQECWKISVHLKDMEFTLEEIHRKTLTLEEILGNSKNLSSIARWRIELPRPKKRLLLEPWLICYPAQKVISLIRGAVSSQLI